MIIVQLLLICIQEMNGCEPQCQGTSVLLQDLSNGMVRLVYNLKQFPPNLTSDDPWPWCDLWPQIGLPHWAFLPLFSNSISARSSHFSHPYHIALFLSFLSSFPVSLLLKTKNKNKNKKKNFLEAYFKNLEPTNKSNSFAYRSQLITFAILKGDWSPNQNWACFVHYPKIVNFVLKTNLSAPKQIVREAQKWP